MTQDLLLTLSEPSLPRLHHEEKVLPGGGCEMNRVGLRLFMSSATPVLTTQLLTLP